MKKAYEGNKEYIFISYSHSDISVVEPFILELQSRYNVWYDEGIGYGEEYRKTIIDKINNCYLFFYLITENSINSDFCLKEIRHAVKKKKNFINIQIQNFSLPEEFDFEYGHFQMCMLYKFKNVKDAIDDLERKCHWLKNIQFDNELNKKSEFDVLEDISFMDKNIQIETIKTELGIDFYNDIIKCDFLIDLIDMFYYKPTPDLIKIDKNDIITIAKNGLLAGVISQSFKKDTTNFDDLCIDTISNRIPTDGIVLITSGVNLSLKTVDAIINTIRNKYNEINIIFGTSIKEHINRIKVQALFTCPKEETIVPKEITDDEATNTEEFHKGLLYHIYLYMLDNGISINSIQQHFFLGFNKTLRIISELEDLGIISKKTGTNKRTILIKDEEEVKKLIYKNK